MPSWLAGWEAVGIPPRLSPAPWWDRNWQHCPSTDTFSSPLLPSLEQAKAGRGKPAGRRRRSSTEPCRRELEPVVLHTKGVQLVQLCASDVGMMGWKRSAKKLKKVIPRRAACLAFAPCTPSLQSQPRGSFLSGGRSSTIHLFCTTTMNIKRLKPYLTSSQCEVYHNPCGLHPTSYGTLPRGTHNLCCESSTDLGYSGMLPPCSLSSCKSMMQEGQSNVSISLPQNRKKSLPNIQLP